MTDTAGQFAHDLNHCFTIVTNKSCAIGLLLITFLSLGSRYHDTGRSEHAVFEGEHSDVAQVCGQLQAQLNPRISQGVPGK